MGIARNKYNYTSSLINKKDSGVDTNEVASKKLEVLLGGNFFDYPKPTSLISYLVGISSSPTDTVLDFFAGSGTAAHAVMEINAKDGGRRKWVCVQSPEPCPPKSDAYKAGYKTIADITKERIRLSIREVRSVSGYREGFDAHILVDKKNEQ